MEIDRRAKPEECCAKTVARFSVTEPWLDAKKEAVYATDGHVLCKIPVVVAGADTDGMVPTALLKHARRSVPRSTSVLVLPMTNDRAEGYGLSIQRTSHEQVPPDVDRVMPRGKPKLRLKIDAVLLLKLAKALGGDGKVELEFHDDDTPMVVRPIFGGGADGAVGAIMPIK